jgi:hypothetical protein
MAKPDATTLMSQYLTRPQQSQSVNAGLTRTTSDCLSGYYYPTPTYHNPWPTYYPSTTTIVIRGSAHRVCTCPNCAGDCCACADCEVTRLKKRVAALEAHQKENT